MQNCAFSLCIYQNAGKCTLPAVDINNMGLCESAVVIELPDVQLHSYKKELIEKLDFYSDMTKLIVFCK